MKKATLLILTLFLLSFGGFGQVANSQTDAKVMTFKFLPGQDMFYIPYSGNGTELGRLYSLVDEYRTEITSGHIPVYVDGYCASGGNTETGFKTAAIRSNRVKSELIINKGLSENHFVTKNHAATYTAPDGISYRDMVVVTLRIPVKIAEPQPVVKEEAKPQPRTETKPEPQPVVEETPPVVEKAVEVIKSSAVSKPYCFAVRTNLLYDALLLPTLGVEWRVNPGLGIKLDGSTAGWSGNEGERMKMWLLNPEVRWYLLGDKRFYTGVSGNFGEYNIYKYPLGSLFSKDTGYQGKMWGAGLTVGYQLFLSRNFSLDFNLGLGYTRFDYESFQIIDGTRVYKDKDKSKNFWGPTQAGVSLVWTIGNNK